jgi:hypothetical protein
VGANLEAISAGHVNRTKSSYGELCCLALWTTSGSHPLRFISDKHRLYVIESEMFDRLRNIASEKHAWADANAELISSKVQTQINHGLVFPH